MKLKEDTTGLGKIPTCINVCLDMGKRDIAGVLYFNRQELPGFSLTTK